MTAFAYLLCFTGGAIPLGFTLPKLFLLLVCVVREAWAD
jgi:hypothetical protein